MEKKSSGSIRGADRAEAAHEIGLFMSQTTDGDVHYYNVFGSNPDGLMHLMGLPPIQYGAAMLTAGIFTIRKARCQPYNVFSFNDDVWNEIMTRKRLLDKVQASKYGRTKIWVVKTGCWNPVAADSAVSRGQVNDMLTAEQQFREKIPPPRLNISKARESLKKALAPHIIGGYDSMSWEVNQQTLSESKAMRGSDDDDEYEYEYEYEYGANENGTESIGVGSDSDDEEYYAEMEDQEEEDEAERDFLQYFEEVSERELEPAAVLLLLLILTLVLLLMPMLLSSLLCWKNLTLTQAATMTTSTAIR